MKRRFVFCLGAMLFAGTLAAHAGARMAGGGG